MMDEMVVIFSWPAVAEFFIIACIFLIHLICKKFVPKHVEYVRNVWYFYFLNAILMILIGALCIHFEFIDAKGGSHGVGGNVLIKSLKFIFALKEDIMLCIGAIALILGPQFASYVFSGILSGCAVRPKHAGVVLKFVTLSFTKSLVTVAGVMLGLGALGWAVGWTGMAGKVATGTFVLSAVFLMLAFYLLSSIVEIQNMDDEPSTSGFRLRWNKVDRWMTRNAKKMD